jgi:acyl-coenzyme A thioesterase PaaI-like protein
VSPAAAPNRPLHHFPPIPAAARLGLEVAATPEGVEVAVDLDERWEAGTVDSVPGVAALLCDAASGGAVALHEPTRFISTALLSLDMIAAPRDRRLRAVGTAKSARGDYVLATAVVRDGGDLEVARATSWWALRGKRAGTPLAAPLRVASADTLSAPAGDGLGATPLGQALGLVPAALGPGDDVAFALAEVGELRNRSGTLHGGVGALLAQLAAVWTVDDGAIRPDVLSLTCHYLRAAGAGNAPVRITGSRVRRGRTSAVARGVVLADDGREAMLATVTVAFPDRAEAPPAGR